MTTTTTTTDAEERRTWLHSAEDEIVRRGLNPEILEVLRAFGGDDAPGPSTLDPNDCGGGGRRRGEGCDDDDDDDDSFDENDVPSLISSSLASEVDADQASVFARRFSSVSSLLSERRTPASSLLLLGLHRRARQILSIDPPPRALRIRALVDFVWSQALVLGNEETLSHLPTLEDLVRGGENSTPPPKYREFAPGMRHGTIEGETSGGPVHVNVLRIERGAATLRTVDARSEGTTDLAELTRRCGAPAAVSGGFFLYSEPDIRPPSRRTDPVGLLVTDGVVTAPPAFGRAALLQDGITGDVSIETVGMDGVTVRIGGERSGDGDGDGDDGNDGDDGGSHSLSLVVGTDGVRCAHRGDAENAELTPDEVGISIVGTSVVRASTPEDRDGNSGTIAIPLAGFVLIFPAARMNGARSSSTAKENAPVSYELPHGPDIHAGMAGGPILLGADRDSSFDAPIDLHSEDFRGTAPPVTFSQDETFDRNLLPRMGAGLTSDGELVLAAVDGRNLDHALGLTLRGTADLLRSLGCVRALNLDGGSSKRMVIRDEVVCLSTTEIKASSSSSRHGNGNGNGGEEIEKEAADAGKEQNAKATPELSRPVHSAILFLPRQS